MTVSIITPCYNAESTIKETIDSVLSQTYQDWEMIIVDDCSKDSSADIIKAYVEKDCRIIYFKTEKSSGSPTKPRNIAIEYASGRYIAFLDSDDIWLPNKLEEQIKLFETDDVAVVYSNYEKITEDGKRNSRIVIAPNTVNYKELLKGNVIGNLTGIYDTQKAGKVFCQKQHHEDYLLWLNVLKQGHIAKNTNTVTALYRVREQSVSSNKLKVIRWQWYIYRNILGLNLLQSCYYFIHYAYRATIKSLR